MNRLLIGLVLIASGLSLQGLEVKPDRVEVEVPKSQPEPLEIKPEVQNIPEKKQSTPTNPVLQKLRLVSVPNIRNYKPIIGVRGMTIRWHLERGAAGEHAGLPSRFVRSLTKNQQYWLHDYLHGYNH
tara:strand:+ start:3865 stop:4245 length:381 start_codon:yes stop_codon:yes gene_type:complete